jgi:hypothetical protein
VNGDVRGRASDRTTFANSGGGLRMGRCLFARCYAMPSRNVEAPRPARFSRAHAMALFELVPMVSAAYPLAFRGSPLGTADGAKSPKRPQPRGGNAQPRAFVKSGRSRGVDPTHRDAVPACHGRPGLGPAQDRRMPRSDVAGASPRSVVTCSGFPHCT